MVDKISVIQDAEKAIEVLRKAGQWLEGTGKNPSKWWQPTNLNKEFLFEYADPEEFYAAVIDGKPVAAMVLQVIQNAQDWQVVDGSKNVPAVYIHWLAVDPTRMGHGLPKRMIDFASAKAEENGVRLLRADTNAAENKLCLVYEGLGFVMVATEKEDYRTTAYYQKQLEA